VLGQVVGGPTLANCVKLVEAVHEQRQNLPAWVIRIGDS
jgi:hypothetical protein